MSPVYPNPASDRLFVQPVTEKGTLEVIDLLGKRLRNETPSAEGMDVSKLRSGLYMVRFKDGGKVRNQRILISR